MTRLLLAGALALATLVPVTTASATSCWPLSCCPPAALDECPDGCKPWFSEGRVLLCTEQH